MRILEDIAFLACFLSMIFCPEEIDGQCTSPQYAEIGRKVIIECVIPSTFTGVVWYNSTNTTNSQVARIERQSDGSLRISGEGVDSGSYDIATDGSLIFPEVSTQHDRNYMVLVFDEHYEVSSFTVELITVVYSNQNLPKVNSCEENLVCFEHVTGSATFSCIFANARPAVTLSWYRYSEGTFEALEATQHTYSDDYISFSSVLDVTISNLTENSLNIFTCEAYAPDAGVEQAKTNILALAQNKEIGNHSRCHTQVKKRTIIVDSLLEIPCTDNAFPFAYIWQYADSSHSEFLMFSINGTEKLLSQMTLPMEVSMDGSLTFPHANWSGTYTCFFMQVDGVSYCNQVEIEVEEASTIRMIPVLVIISLISVAAVSIYVFIWYQRMILNKYVKMSDAIKNWHFENMDWQIFDEDAINLLRFVSKETKENRKEKNLNTILESCLGIAGVGMTVATGGAELAPAGVVAGVAGPVTDFKDTYGKTKKDKSRAGFLKPALETFVSIQRDLAETVVLLTSVYEIVESVEWKERLSKDIMEISESFHQKLRTLSNGERKTFAQIFHELNIEATKLVNTIISPENVTNNHLLLHNNPMLERYRQEDEKDPFKYLEEAVKKLLRKQRDCNDAPTLLTFIKSLYASDATVANCNAGVQIVTKDAENNARGFAAAAVRVAVIVLNFSDDAARVGANVTKIVKGVVAAGKVLSAFSVVIDMFFLKRAVIDILSDDKEPFSHGLLDVADVMEKMNRIASEMHKEASVENTVTMQLIA